MVVNFTFLFYIKLVKLRYLSQYLFHHLLHGAGGQAVLTWLCSPRLVLVLDLGDADGRVVVSVYIQHSFMSCVVNNLSTVCFRAVYQRSAFALSINGLLSRLNELNVFLFWP